MSRENNPIVNGVCLEEAHTLDLIFNFNVKIVSLKGIEALFPF